MKTLVITLVGAACLMSCAHMSSGKLHMYRFTCPDGSTVRLKVSQDELNNRQGEVYDKVTALCNKESAE